MKEPGGCSSHDPLQIGGGQRNLPCNLSDRLLGPLVAAFRNNVREITAESISLMSTGGQRLRTHGRAGGGVDLPSPHDPAGAKAGDGPGEEGRHVLVGEWPS